MPRRQALKDRKRFDQYVYGKRSATHFDEALDQVSAESRFMVLDAISCALHNEGYALQGNSETNDVRWLAQTLYERATPERLRTAPWDNLPGDEREGWLKIALATIQILPMFCDRLAARYLNLKKAMNLLLRAEDYYKAKGYTYADKETLGGEPETDTSKDDE